MSGRIVSPKTKLVLKQFVNLIQYYAKFTNGRVADSANPEFIKMFKFDDAFLPEVEYSLLIKADFRVETYKGHMKIVTGDLVNMFSCKVTKFSHVDQIIDRLENTPVNVRCELRFLEENVLNLADEVEQIEVQKRRKVTFTGKLLLAIDGNRFYNKEMTEAINLYLRSRNSYKEILVLPCRNTICDYFGKQGLSGGAQECERTVKVFSALNEGQKDCFVTFMSNPVYSTKGNTSLAMH